MFEVIISSVTTGRVRRKFFDSRDEANQYADNFFSQPVGPKQRPRSARNYRVETYFRALPAVRPLPLRHAAAPAA